MWRYLHIGRTNRICYFSYLTVYINLKISKKKISKIERKSNNIHICIIKLKSSDSFRKPGMYDPHLSNQGLMKYPNFSF